MKKNFKQNVEQIKMPEEMRTRVIKNCYEKMEEMEMRKQKDGVLFRKPMAAAAAVALCICLVGTSAMAASGKLQGFFKDIKGWNGAVVGTSYEQATEEMVIGVAEASGQLAVEVVFVDPEKAPYGMIEQLAVGSYKIVDDNGTVIVEDGSSDFADIADGKVLIHIPLEEMMGGSYQLIISELVGASKADQPLAMSGHWECEFVKK